MAKYQEPMVLVGFGKQDLKDILYKIGTDEEEELVYAPTRSPPRYRRKSICTTEDIEAFMTYGRFIQEKLRSK